MIGKSPLRYPGAKQKYLEILDPFFPETFDYYCEPFVGGASVAFYVQQTRRPKNIWINDAYRPVWAFWWTLQKNPTGLIEGLFRRLDETAFDQADMPRSDEPRQKGEARPADEAAAEDRFAKARTRLNDNLGTPLEQAVDFYFFNRCSQNGTGTAGFSFQAWWRWAGHFKNKGKTGRYKIQQAKDRILDLKTWSDHMQGWHITHEDYAYVLDKIGKPASGGPAFAFLDPPYDLTESKNNRLYGQRGSTHKTFNHVDFSKVVHQLDPEAVKALITYNAEVIGDYQDMPICIDYPKDYTMVSVGDYRAKQKQRRELVVANFTTEGSRAAQAKMEAAKMEAEAAAAPVDIAPAPPAQMALFEETPAAV